jgi:imidazole glycerol-phosphate synthase subunit HisH
MLAVVDYGLGNLRSICSALERLEVQYQRTSDKDMIGKADGLILPGVGAFPDGMNNLHRLGLAPLLDELVIGHKRPILGICLGFQLMASEGREFGHMRGLGWIEGSVVRMEPAAENVRVPHMGWNDCQRVRESPLFSDIPQEALFYFTHSYHMDCADKADIAAFSDHGGKFVAAVQKENIFGTQFHPEKSQSQGLSLLRNFARKVVSGC